MMSQNTITVFFLVMIVLTSPAAPLMSDDYVTEDAASGHYNFQRGQYFNGKTYFCFQGAGNDFLDPMVMSYDHGSGTLKGPVKVGDNPLVSLGKEDSHGNPGMVVDKQGFIHVVYGGHGRLGAQLYSRSKFPDDISSWVTKDNIEQDTTYPTLLVLSDGTIVLFFRDGRANHCAGWAYQTSANNGNSWSAPVQFLKAGTKRTDGVYHESSPYFDSFYARRYLNDSQDSIHVVFKYHAHRSSERFPDVPMRRVNLYYAKMLKDGTWVNDHGKELAIPLTLESVDRECRIYESKPKKGAGVVNTTEPMNLYLYQDRPYINLRVRTRKNDHYNGGISYLLHWTGASWKRQRSPASGVVKVYSQDKLEIYHNDLYRSLDGGATWKKIAAIHSQGGRFHLLYQHHDDAKLWFQHAGDVANGSDQETRARMYLWGASGFIRPGKTVVNQPKAVLDALTVATENGEITAKAD
jgi:hypothetical protein